jgi:hypothetical protein
MTRQSSSIPFVKKLVKKVKPAPRTLAADIMLDLESRVFIYHVKWNDKMLIPSVAKDSHPFKFPL